MGKVNIPPLQISFCRSTLKNYKQALQIIQSHRSYYLDEGGEKTIVIPPVWPASKAEVVRAITTELRRRGSCQGARIAP